MRRRRLRYGPHRSQVASLYLPSRRVVDGEKLPVVVLIHGGFWRSYYTKVLMAGLARSVVARGWAAWNVEYRRLGRIGGGGGYPETFDDVAAATDHLASVGGLDLDRVVACGHSAGGHLALWLAARHRLPTDAPGTPVRVPVSGVVTLAALSNLGDLDATSRAGERTVRFMGGNAAGEPMRWEIATPIEHLPLGVPQVLVHGLDDRAVPPAWSENYVRRAMDAGDPAVYVPVAGVGHQNILRASGAGWRAALPHLERMLDDRSGDGAAGGPAGWKPQLP